MRKGLQLCFGVLFVTLVEASWGQKASNWRVYRVADGLPESACSAVTISPRGRVLVRHFNLASISELDGYAVNVIPAPANGFGRIYEFAAGHLWMAAPEGLAEYKEGEWVLHPVPQIAAACRSGSASASHPVPLCPVDPGRVLFLLPQTLMELSVSDPDRLRTRTLLEAGQTTLGEFTGLTVANDGGLWITGARGLVKAPGPIEEINPETRWQRLSPPSALAIEYFGEPHADEDGGVTFVADSSVHSGKMVVRFDGQAWTGQPAGAEDIRQAWRGPDKSFWVATPDSLFQVEQGRPELVENEEIAARKYFDVAVEADGAFWLATSDGLFHYILPIWGAPAPVAKITSPVRCLTEDAAGRLWFLAGNDLHSLKDGLRKDYPLRSVMARIVPATRALFPLKNRTLLLDAGEQWVQIEPESGTLSNLTSLEGGRQLRPIGVLRDGSLCLRSSEPGAGEPAYQLELYDGAKFTPFSPGPPESFLAGELTSLLATEKGDLWLGGDHGVAWYHDLKWRTFSAADKNGPASVVGFLELSDGRLWCAAPDAIWQFDGRVWSPVWPWSDRINGLLRSHDGTIWVAANNGLARLFKDSTWVENGVEEGLPSTAVREIYEDQHTNLWAATARGLSLYNPQADLEPPRTTIQKLMEKESSIPEDATITLRFAGLDKWNNTLRGRLLYSYRLDDREWSPFQDTTSVSFSDLPAGKHSFEVRALDRNCRVDPRPARAEFAVTVPWYVEPRLLMIGFAGLAVALFFAALAVNRHRQLRRSYAEVERKVAERTRELEMANRALLHSQKMHALGTLAAGIAHDFNNILSIIKGSAQIIEDNLDNPQKVHTRVDRIKTVVEQGAGIIRAMLGFSRGSGELPALCDVNAVVDDTITLLGDRFLREVEVRFHRAPSLPEVPASKDFVQQILLNFIFNAAESLGQHKQVILATQWTDKLPAGVVLMPVTASAYVCASVQDFGCGIPPENLPRIFEPFFTTKDLSARRGTGLGLSMAHELARKMEAGLAVESVVGQGSTFMLILPVRDLPADTKSSTL